MTDKNRCQEAKHVIHDALYAKLFPTVIGVGIGAGSADGEYSLALYEQQETQSPPSYHGALIALLTEHGFGDVEVTYRHIQRPHAQ